MAQVLVNEDYLDSAGAALQEKLGQKVSPKNFGKEIRNLPSNEYKIKHRDGDYCIIKNFIAEVQ